MNTDNFENQENLSGTSYEEPLAEPAQPTVGTQPHDDKSQPDESADYDKPARMPTKGLLAVRADYHNPGVEAYKGNPCIEALPKILAKEETQNLLWNLPKYHEASRQDPSEVRLHHIWTLAQVFVPRPGKHDDLEERISRLIRQGYLSRNPLDISHYQDIRERVLALGEAMSSGEEFNAAPSGFNLLGISGVGKSTALNKVLSLYPRLIFHGQYRDGRNLNLTQVAWLKLDCPHDGSVRGLCLSFFAEMDKHLGTNYWRNYSRGGRATKDEMLVGMARVAELHSLGMLVIDEIQHLSGAGADRAHMLNFFVQLHNDIGLPVILVGTYKAIALLTGEFRQARRGSGQGDMVWDRMQEDDAWHLFLSTLWEYQYTRKTCPLTPALSHRMYEESQGITDIAVKLYMLAQARAITSEKETITASIITSVAKDSLRLVRPVLQALRNNNTDALTRVEDVYVNIDAHIWAEMGKLVTENGSAKPDSSVKQGSPAQGDGTHQAMTDIASTPNPMLGSHVEPPASSSAGDVSPVPNAGGKGGQRRGQGSRKGSKPKLQSELKQAISTATTQADIIGALRGSGFVQSGSEFLSESGA